MHPWQRILFGQVKRAGSTVPKGLTPPLDPSDPFADDERERREVEEMAKRFESKYVSVLVSGGRHGSRAGVCSGLCLIPCCCRVVAQRRRKKTGCRISLTSATVMTRPTLSSTIPRPWVSILSLFTRPCVLAVSAPVQMFWNHLPVSSHHWHVFEVRSKFSSLIPGWHECEMWQLILLLYSCDLSQRAGNHILVKCLFYQLKLQWSRHCIRNWELDTNIPKQ